MKNLKIRIISSKFTFACYMLVDHTAVFQTARAGFRINMALITIIANPIGGMLIYVQSAWATTVTAPLPILVCLCSVIYILGRVPISVPNLGMREVTLFNMADVHLLLPNMYKRLFRKELKSLQTSVFSCIGIDQSI